ncbi:twin-arginine translocation protein TatC [Lachnospiraceae bacterium KM106-2]|nr:twin-arginine translocation protein TatC [Lachnospiraceae bacterium KM106-2]
MKMSLKSRFKKKEENQEMNLRGHLKELRNRIVICLVSLIVGFAIVFHFSSSIVQYLTSMGTSVGYRFVYISPQELFLQYMKVGFIGAICLASPIIIYQIARFIAPGLKKSENVVMFFSIIFGFIFFIVGVVFALKITIPFMLDFFYNVNTSSNISSFISIENYVGMLVMIFLIFGIVFELPVVTVILTQMGLLRPEWMVKGRPAAIVVIFFVGAIITPPDIMSQCLLAGPMIILYQISIYLCMIFRKRKLKTAKEEEE